MSLDVCYLTFLINELNGKLSGSRVEKISMPSRDETVMQFGGGASKKILLINTSSNAPRISLINTTPENPEKPPVFCMVLRKHFTSAKLLRVYMPSFERIAVFEFECRNDFFEPVIKNITVELMGRSANMILTENGKITDAVRRVDMSASGRSILPGLTYCPPPEQEGKIPFDSEDCLEKVFSNPELTLEKAIMSNISGISPIISRELAFKSAGRSDMYIRQLGKSDFERLSALCGKIRSELKENKCAPCIVYEKQSGKFVDFTFMPITHYGDYCLIKEYETPSDAVTAFYAESAAKTRLEQKTKDLSQFITRTSQRTERTMAVRQKELEQSERADYYRLCGELINANLYRMAKGETKLVAENYYDDCKEITVPLKAQLSPSENAAAYFKKYTKLKNSADILKKLIEKDREELDYLESVFLALCDCETAAEADEIRLELENAGYIKRRLKRKSSESACRPREYTKDGFTVLVGRNNIQNDLLTVKMSRKNDMWLHTKAIHSSHVLIVCGGKTPPDTVIEYAASLCAYYSKGRNDLKVDVDYCPVQNVRKPSGAKAGMVVYENYETVTVRPYREENK